MIAESAPAKLRTWKEIAGYLGCDERTAKRWENSRGLPVKRPPGAIRSTVYAYAGDLEAWLSRGAIEPAAEAEPPSDDDQSRSVPRRRRSWLLAGVPIAAALAAMLYFGGGRGRGVEAVAGVSPNPPPELYMRGLYAWNTRTGAGLKDGIADFSQVILHDPRYAPAYVGLADCYSLMPEFGGMSAALAYPQAKLAAERAVALDPHLAGAHGALAFVDFWWSHDVAGSRREFERALSLDPDVALTRHWYANTLGMAGNFPKAIAEIDEAERLEPATTAIRADKALLLWESGRATEAVEILNAIESEQPEFAQAHSYLSDIYFNQGNDPDAIEEMASAARLSPDQTAIAVARAAEAGYRLSGHIGMTKAVLAEQAALFRKGRYSPFTLAESYAAIDKDQSFALLGEAAAQGDPLIMGLRVDPNLRPLHGDARFGALVAGVHLPPV